MLVAAFAACGGSGPGLESGPAERQSELRGLLRPRPAERAALPALEAAVAGDRADATAHADLSSALIDRGSYGRSLEVAVKGLASSPGDPRLSYLAGEANRRIGQHDRAVDHFQVLLGQVPDFADGHFALCGSFAHRAPAAAVGSPTNIVRADLDSAVAHCRMAVSLEAGNPVFHHNLGLILYLLDDYGGAAAAHRRAIDLGYATGGAYLHLGRALERQGDLPAAAAALRRSVESEPNESRSLYWLGRVLSQQGFLAEAADQYSRSLALQPEAADVHYSLALVWYRLGRDAEGERHMALFERLDDAPRSGVRALELEVQRTPVDAALRRDLAAAHVQLGRYRAAAEELRVAAALEPHHLSTLCDLALVLVQIDQPDGPGAFWKELWRWSRTMPKPPHCWTGCRPSRTRRKVD